MPSASASDPASDPAGERRWMLNWYSATYHTRNRDERNAKTRARMAKLRLQEITLPPAEQEARQAARRSAAQKYRIKNSAALAKKAQQARASASAAKEREQVRSNRRERIRQEREQMREAESGCP
ncbi:hypothetical protein DFH06DRAFT_1352342 [Mycena polygramma]|nr:hypothetical protein DFH06DRAFT_1352342 [Mycena polygramma]